MNKTFVGTLLAAALVGLPALAQAQLQVGGQIFVGAPPPPVQAEAPPPMTAPGMVWVPGNWMWNGQQHVWQRGHWDNPPQMGARWMPARWERRGRQWMFVPGRWRGNRGWINAQPGMAPQPPVVYAQPQQPPVVYAQPQQPPVVYAQPQQPPVVYVQPQQPGGVYVVGGRGRRFNQPGPQPGVVYAQPQPQPGVVYAQPQPQPGVVYAQPGVRPGVVYAQPQQPGVVVAQPVRPGVVVAPRGGGTVIVP